MKGGVPLSDRRTTRSKDHAANPSSGSGESRAQDRGRTANDRK
jgi:hypothetical protein